MPAISVATQRTPITQQTFCPIVHLYYVSLREKTIFLDSTSIRFSCLPHSEEVCAHRAVVAGGPRSPLQAPPLLRPRGPALSLRGTFHACPPPASTLCPAGCSTRGCPLGAGWGPSPRPRGAQHVRLPCTLQLRPAPPGGSRATRAHTRAGSCTRVAARLALLGSPALSPSYSLGVLVVAFENEGWNAHNLVRGCATLSGA